MGDEQKQQLCLRGLRNSAGFLQQKVGKRIDTRYTPKLKFVLDQGVKRSIEVSRILREVLPDEHASDDEAIDAEAADFASDDEATFDDLPPGADPS